MAEVIIFGIKDFAQLANYYLENDTDHQVAAFCVSDEYMPDKREFVGKPVISFENVYDTHPPGDYKFFVPMSSREVNKAREDIYNSVKSMGYEFISYISSKATIFNSEIGENCFILENNTIQPFTRIGNNVMIWSGNHIGHHSEVGNNVFITSHVVISGNCRIGNNCFLGVNSSIRDGLTLEEGTVIGMGSVVLKDTDKWSVYHGNPAEKIIKPCMEAKI